MKPRRGGVLWIVLVFALGGCDMAVRNSDLTGRASDEWTRRYTLAPGGELAIVNSNGVVEVEGVDGTEVDVRAERIAKAATDEAAKELLQRVGIKENASPERVAIDTERITGITLGVSYEVRYHVRAPRNLTLDVRTSNGAVSVSNMTGKVIAHTTNGAVTGTALAGAVDARTNNGAVNVDLASAGENPVSLHTTNGAVTLALPDTAKATIAASWTNGGFRVAPELKVEVADQSRRRFEGRLNGGGASIELQTTNGPINLTPRGARHRDAEKP